MKPNPKTLGPVTHTSRGFELITFKDRNDVKCSLQMSSLADYEQPGISALWLGPDDAQPKVLASQAASFGVKTLQSTGWVDYPIPDEVNLTTRAHLNREQVEALISHLKAWLKTGSLKVQP